MEKKAFYSREKASDLNAVLGKKEGDLSNSSCSNTDKKSPVKSMGALIHKDRTATPGSTTRKSQGGIFT